MTVAAYGPMVATALEAAAIGRRGGHLRRGASTCARSRRSTSTPSRRRCARRAAWSWPTRHRSSAAWAPRSPPASRSAASTTSRRRCGGWAASPRRTRRRKLEQHYLPDADRILHEVDRCLGCAVSEVRRFRLPDLGEGLTEAEVVAWHVAAGDTVTLNQVLAEVETEKAVVELPSPFAGTVVELLAAAGRHGRRRSRPSSPSRPGAGRDRPGRPRRHACPMLVGLRPGRRRAEPSARRTTAGARPPRLRVRCAATPAPTGRPAGRAPGALHGAPDTGSTWPRWPATGPAASSPAKTWPRIWSTTSAAGAARRRPAGRRARDARTPHGVRKHMAEAMVRSVAAAPQACVFLTVDVTPTMRAGATRCGPTATSRAHVSRRSPSWPGPSCSRSSAPRTQLVVGRGHRRGRDQALREPRHRGGGTARASSCPTSRTPRTLTLRDLVRRPRRADGEGPRRPRTPDDLRGGTITITNVGVFGVDAGVPILNPGEAAIVAMGAVQRAPLGVRGRPSRCATWSP